MSLNPMQFSLNKSNLTALIQAFAQDKVAKSTRKIERHGLHRVFGTFEARDDTFHVDSGRVKLALKAAVNVPGAFSMRDAVFRELLKTLRDDAGLKVVATPSGLQINGAAIQFSDLDFRFPPYAATDH